MHQLRPLAFVIGLALLSGCGRSAPVAPRSHTAGQSAAPPAVLEDSLVIVADFRPDSSGARSGGIQFPIYPPGSATFRIIDSAGRLVRFMPDALGSGSNGFAWDGRTDSGLPVGCGVYFFEIDFSTGERFVGRLVLVR